MAARIVSGGDYAAREQVQWLNGHANASDAVEKICPARHIGEKQWQSEWNEMYHASWSYEYISDYEYIFNHPIDAGTLEPLAYTRASSAEFCYPILE